jgi:Arc/MetJ-type ribon-helix-helix transcriptional regulator
MLSAQLQTDSPLNERFEEFRETEGFESKSEAVRAALRLGLDDYESNDGPDRSATDELLLSTASNLATIAIVVALVAAAGLLSPAAGALIGGVSLLSALMLIGEVRYRAVRTLSPLGAPKEVTE